MKGPSLRFLQSQGIPFPALKEELLKDVVDFYKGYSLSKEDVVPISDSWKGNPCVLYGHLYTTYQEIAQTPGFVTDISTKDKFISESGDVLMPTSDVTPKGLATATCILFSGALIGGDINILRPKKILDGRYLSLIINSRKDKLYPLIVGSTVRHLHANSLKGLKYFFPCLEEQQKIAAFFTALDEKIHNLETQLEEIDKFKNGLFGCIFSTKKIKEWNRSKFSQEFEFKRTFSLSRKEISTDKCIDGEEIKIIHYGDILTKYGDIVDPQKDQIGYALTKLSVEDEDYLKDGDIVFADAAEDYSVGKAIEMVGINSGVLSGLHTIAATPKKSFCKRIFKLLF